MCLLPGMPQRAASYESMGGGIEAMDNLLPLDEDLSWLDYTFGVDDFANDCGAPMQQQQHNDRQVANEFFADQLEFATDPFASSKPMEQQPYQQQQQHMQYSAPQYHQEQQYHETYYTHPQHSNNVSQEIEQIKDLEQHPIPGFEGYFYSNQRHAPPTPVPSAVMRSTSGSSAGTTPMMPAGSLSPSSSCGASSTDEASVDYEEVMDSRKRRACEMNDMRYTKRTRENIVPSEVQPAPASPSGFSSPGLAEEMEYDQGRWKPAEIAMVMNITRVYISQDLKTISDIANFCGIRRPKRAIDKHLKRMLKYDRWINRDEAKILAKIAVYLQSSLPPLTKTQAQRLKEAQSTWRP